MSGRRKKVDVDPMIRGLRLKFVAVTMVLVTLMLGAVVYAASLSARQDLERLSSGVLHRVIREEPGQYGTDIGAGKVALPYFTVDILGETVYVTGGTYADIEDTEVLTAILSECLGRKETEGLLPAYGLRYLHRADGWRDRWAFVDISMEAAALREILESYALIALTALLPLLGVSILLSWWAVAPVERAWRQQRQFLADASHELKTPLTVILSDADLLSGAGLEDRPRRWAGDIRSEARRMKTLVEEMLSLARSDAAPRAAVLEEVCLSDVAADRALSFEPVAFEAGKDLRYEIAPDVTVLGDGARLGELISVLLDNAVKYGEEGGQIVLGLGKSGRDAVLTVSDTGDPIPPEALPHLFERFYRADASRGQRGGSGLGLSIAEAVAREHRGSLRAESGEGWNRFTYTMPLRR